MKTILYPEKKIWDSLCQRPAINRTDLEVAVRDIINSVRLEMDSAIYRYSKKFDGVAPGNLKVSVTEINEAIGQVPANLKVAIKTAKTNIEKFHSAQLQPEPVIETFKGVKCWRKNVAIEKVGLYIPGGSAPLFSTVLMLGIPAKIAGCKEIIICTPSGKDGKVSPLILYTAQLIGITEIYKVGGAQAIAAMAYGTESVPKVYKIFGPGNQYVTKAKELVQQDGIAIDLPAGPSEVLVIADSNANTQFIAADLLSQAEHGADSQVIILTDNQTLTGNVKSEVEKQIQLLPRKVIALKALENSKLILLSSLDDCIEFSNLYAPEHLIINTSDTKTYAEKVTNAGSVFLGEFSCESAGDYASGTNHTLPTNGFAKNYSGVSTESFIKKISFQEINAEGIRDLGPSIEIMAEAESLFGHKNAVSIRLKSLQNG
ncbi:MAG: histidinol dehydrogenase [Bacteroidetes bacterium]|nr:MAG: histidinol dehydrogenase [Bacteroidota bacterium]